MNKFFSHLRNIFFILLLTTSSVYALETVPHVDLQRYLGKWYEIAKYPNRFQKNCAVSKAEYSILEPGIIKVNNQCIDVDGKIDQAIGKAYVVDPSQAKLKVQFFLNFLNLPFLQGDYWIIKLDENYQYAVVSEPSQEYLWILSRTPNMEEDTYQELLKWLEARGFELNKIVKDNYLLHLPHLNSF